MDHQPAAATLQRLSLPLRPGAIGAANLICVRPVLIRVSAAVTTFPQSAPWLQPQASAGTGVHEDL